MVEVDRERGRIGLRLADDPDIAGKSVEELATVGSGDGGGSRGGGGRDRGRRNGRSGGGGGGGDRGPGARAATAIRTAAERRSTARINRLRASAGAVAGPTLHP